MFERKKLRINVNKSKDRAGEQASWSESLNEENLKEVKCIIYLGVGMTVNGTIAAEASHIVDERGEGPGCIAEFVERSLPRMANMGMFQGTVVLTMLYGCEEWVTDKDAQRRVEV